MIQHLTSAVDNSVEDDAFISTSDSFAQGICWELLMFPVTFSSQIVLAIIAGIGVQLTFQVSYLLEKIIELLGDTVEIRIIVICALIVIGMIFGVILKILKSNKQSYQNYIRGKFSSKEKRKSFYSDP